MSFDTLSDFLIRIKNGYLAGKKQIEAPYFRLGEEIAKILVREGYLDKISLDKEKKQLILGLKYEGKKPAVNMVRIISKPGLRIYLKKNTTLPRFRGLGVFILSTSRGILTFKEAKKLGVGGEAICQIF